MARFKVAIVVGHHFVGMVVELVEEAAIAALVEIGAAVADIFRGGQADDFEASEGNLEHLIEF